MQTQASAQVMDRMYRHQRHIYDASRRFYLLGRDEMIRGLRPPAGGHVLEIGCGTGRNLVAAARRYPSSRFYGCDISREMLKSAQGSLKRAGLSDRIGLAQGDATCFDPRKAFQRNRFDRIYFSYTLSMIPGWERAAAHAMDLLAPEGQLHIVDFGQCERLPAAARTVLFAWLRKFDVMPCAGLQGTLQTDAEARHHTLSFAPLYRGYAWHAVVSAH